MTLEIFPRDIRNKRKSFMKFYNFMIRRIYNLKEDVKNFLEFELFIRFIFIF